MPESFRYEEPGVYRTALYLMRPPFHLPGVTPSDYVLGGVRKVKRTLGFWLFIHKSSITTNRYAHDSKPPQ